MSSLVRYTREVTTVFDLLGRGEVDLTAALGWALTVSPSLRRALWSHLDMPGDPDDVELALETPDDAGRTDLEMRLQSGDTQALVVLEAKKGWLQPDEVQLGKYVGRFTGIDHGLLVSLSDSSALWAARELPKQVAGVPVRHVPWDEVRTLLRSIFSSVRSPSERLWLGQLRDYLKEATAVRAYDSQWVYVVALNGNRFGSHTFIEWVRDQHIYFHPFGKGWPKRPPILMGFRWNGRLQQVNRVEGTRILPSLQDEWPDMPKSREPSRPYGPHAVYTLGSDLRVPSIPTGKIHYARRTWVLLDQLLTAPTIYDAEQASKALQADAPD